MASLKKHGSLHLFPQFSTLLDALRCEHQRDYWAETAGHKSLLLELHTLWMACGRPQVEWPASDAGDAAQSSVQGVSFVANEASTSTAADDTTSPK